MAPLGISDSWETRDLLKPPHLSGLGWLNVNIRNWKVMFSLFRWRKKKRERSFLQWGNGVHPESTWFCQDDISCKNPLFRWWLSVSILERILFFLFPYIISHSFIEFKDYKWFTLPFCHNIAHIYSQIDTMISNHIILA